MHNYGEKQGDTHYIKLITKKQQTFIALIASYFYTFLKKKYKRTK
jgi:hypothetical protein